MAACPSTQPGRGFVGEDIAEHVFGDEDVKTGRVRYQAHGSSVDQQVIEADLRDGSSRPGRRSRARARAFEDIGFVDRGRPFADG